MPDELPEPNELPFETEGWLEITRRRLPHWRLKGSIYFITWRTLGRRLLSPRERDLVMDAFQAGAGKHFDLLAAVVMPDHVHLIIHPLSQESLARITGGIKRCTSDAINRARGSHGAFWQDESYDRIIRDEKELVEKIGYVMANPMRAGVAADWQEYRWLFIDEDHGPGGC